MYWWSSSVFICWGGGRKPLVPLNAKANFTSFRKHTFFLDPAWSLVLAACLSPHQIHKAQAHCLGSRVKSRTKDGSAVISLCATAKLALELILLVLLAHGLLNFPWLRAIIATINSIHSHNSHSHACRMSNKRQAFTIHLHPFMSSSPLAHCFSPSNFFLIFQSLPFSTGICIHISLILPLRTAPLPD